ncbi:MAG: putative baseplate assembly protein, partial [Leptolyngbya sp. SIO1D8]|nr:putative baseplate assembly protein [Leptolyngbya sp. SIO1D8]
MNSSQLYCQNERRRQLVRQYPRNGLDYLEVSDDQQQLCVHFLGPVPQNLEPANVRIEGGQVIRDIQVIALELELQDDPTLDSCLRVTVSEPGDFSPYTLKIVALDEAGRCTDQPHPDFDPRYSSLTFSFKVDCPNDLDCLTDTFCLPTTTGDETAAAAINYLAKDYASFRQLILDRLALLMPDWQEHHVPDLGITLVE